MEPFPALRPSHFPQLRHCGVLGLHATPVTTQGFRPCSLGCDSTPGSYALQSGFTLLFPSDLGRFAGLLRRSRAGLFILAFPGPSLAHPLFLSGDPAACLVCTLPLSAPHFASSGPDSAPGSLASQRGSLLTQSSILTVASPASGTSGGIFRLPSRSHESLFALALPGATVGPSLFPQLRLCVVLWSAHHPCQEARL